MRGTMPGYGAHSRPITRMAITSAQLTASRPRDSKPLSNSSNFSACHSTRESHTAPKFLERSSRTASTRTATASMGVFGSNRFSLDFSFGRRHHFESLSLGATERA